MGGLTTEEIARGFPIMEATVGSSWLGRADGGGSIRSTKIGRNGIGCLSSEDRPPSSGERPFDSRGPYLLRAAVAACLGTLRPSLFGTRRNNPVTDCRVGRTGSFGMAFGPAAAVEIADAWLADPVLQN